MSNTNENTCQESGENSSPENVMLDIIRTMDTISEERHEEKENPTTGFVDTGGEPSREESVHESDPVLRKDRNEKVSMSRTLVRSASSILSIEPKKPETPKGWAALLGVVGTALTMHEIRLQKSLTGPPLVFAQKSPTMDRLQEILSKNTTNQCEKGMLTRDVRPSLFVGTRSHLASMAAYAFHGPKEKHLRFEEKMRMEADGAEVSVVWEVPRQSYQSSLHTHFTNEEQKEKILNGPISRPVVIICHGINNDANFGYMKALMRSCSDKGWIACGVNFRGCGGLKMVTPRGYNAGYTGDLRSVIQKVEARLQEDVPIFLMGNSLGANIMTKYLGEEGYSKTLPKCIAGAVSLGNPLYIRSDTAASPWAEILGLGVKKTMLANWKTLRHMTCFHFQSAVRKALLSRTIGQLDEELAPFLVRNEPHYPFEQKIGYENGTAYWHDASSNRYIQHISVPILNLSSLDDFLVKKHALNSLEKCIVNPNVLVVKTKCGGHLGWQESPPDGTFGLGKSWAATAAAEFIAAILEIRSYKDTEYLQTDAEPAVNEQKLLMNAQSLVEDMYSSKALTSKL